MSGPVRRAICLVCGYVVWYLPSRHAWRHVTRRQDDHAPLPGRYYT